MAAPAGTAAEAEENAMGERFWYGLGILASVASGVFAVVWMTTH
ncbi:hypothetical protein [Streptomyces griseorubiginosus]